MAASARLEATNGSEAAPSERVYEELLEAKRAEHEDGVATRVVIDVVAGTSFGGINGVFLAKAVAHNHSLDSLRDLWLTRADAWQLVRGPRWLPRLWRVGSAFRQITRTAPLRDDNLSRWLYEALSAMDEVGRPQSDVPTLMPEDHPLDLFVTATDFYGYGPSLARGATSAAKPRHRHVLAFRYTSAGVDDLQAKGNGMLAFAARATSSVPGAFPPASLDRFVRDVPMADVAIAPRFFRSYALSGASASSAFFVDGTVVDGDPFAAVLGAVGGRSASVEVDRRVVYVDPDPGSGLAAARREPGPVTMALGSTVGLPREDGSVARGLAGVEAANERVRRVRDIVESSFPDIAKLVEGSIGRVSDLSTEGADSRLVAEWSARIRHRRRPTPA